MPKNAKEPTSAAASERVLIRNVNIPGSERPADARMYRAMRSALAKVLPPSPPGLTQAEMFEAVIAYLPEDLFPGGAKAGWWVKAVQLDLEAQGLLIREPTKPLRWHAVGSL